MIVDHGRLPAIPRVIFIGGIFVAFAGLLIAMSWIASGGDATFPPPPGDTQDYDNIALQLVHGRGFVIEYADPEWRRPYEQHNQEGDFDEILARKTLRANTDRAPLLPLALAITYRIFGRDFLTWRIIEALLTSLALALICDAVWRAFGSAVALATSAVMFLSSTYAIYVAQFGLVAEPLALTLVAMFMWLLSRLTATNVVSIAAFAGVTLALLCLCRTFYVTWLPFLAVLLWWSVNRSGTAPGAARQAALVFIAAAVLPQVPWWIRNCRVAGAFVPFHMETVSPMTGHSALIAPVFWLAALAPLVMWRRRAVIATDMAVIVAVIVALNFGALAFTQASSWRILVPVEPLLSVLAAVPIATVLFGSNAVRAEAA